MIKVEPCKGCDTPLLVDAFMGVRVRCEPTPMGVPEAGQAILAGRTLHRVLYQGGRPSSFTAATPAVLAKLRSEPSDRPVVVGEHRCARLTAEQGVKGPSTPATAPKALQSPPVAPGTPSSGRSSPARAGTADRTRSEVRCSGCGEPCEDGTYAAVHLGDLLVWAEHVSGGCAAVG